MTRGPRNILEPHPFGSPRDETPWEKRRREKWVKEVAAKASGAFSKTLKRELRKIAK